MALNPFNKLHKKFYEHQLFLPLLALLLLLLFNLIFTKNFFSIEIRDGHLYGSVIDILNRATPLMVLALGMTLVIASGGIDISVGSILAISGAVAAAMIGGKMVFVGGHQEFVSIYPMWMALVAALVVSALCGLWNGLLVAKLGIQAMVATLILLVAGRGIAQLITDGKIITVYYQPFFYIGSGFLFGLPFSIFIVTVFYFLIWFLVKRTAFGLFLESVGSNRLASRFSGLGVQKITWICYLISGICAGIAGLIISSEVKSADANNAGLFIELDAILSFVLGGNSMAGGRFSLFGSVIGALIVQTLTTTIYAIGVAPEITMVVKALVVVAICLIQIGGASKKVKASPASKAKEVRDETATA